MKYFKIFNDYDEAFGVQCKAGLNSDTGFQYKDGLNTETVPFNNNQKITWGRGGLYFADENFILCFLDNGNFIREVSVPKGAKQLTIGNKYRAESLFLHPRRDLREVSTWKWLTECGVEVTANANYAIQWASEKGHLDVVKYLVEQGADINILDNYPVTMASQNGELEVVKYLVSVGADVTANNNLAIRGASVYNNASVVEFLLANGATL